MKTILVAVAIICFLQYALATSIANEFRTADFDCKKELKISKEDASKLLQSIENPTEETKLYFNCFLEKLGFLKNNILQEKYILNKADEYSDAGYLKKFVNKCKHIKGENQIETAVQLGLCFHNSNRKEEF